jgi:hypothetical protein
MATYPPMLITFDDGTTVEVVAKARDLVRAEADGFDFASGANPIRAMYAVAYSALSRMARTDGVDPKLVPATFDEFLDVVDVEGVEEPAGNSSGQEA